MDYEKEIYQKPIWYDTLIDYLHTKKCNHIIGEPKIYLYPPKISDNNK